MQKKLIALAITAAFASAPAFAADTAAYGLVDVGFGSVSNTHTTTAGVATKTGETGTAFSQNQTSRVGIKSTEDLGNGMKAIYQLEMGLSSNPAAAAAFGASTISMFKGFETNSTIGVDRVLTAGLDFGQGTTLVGGKLSSPLRGIVYGNDAMYGANLIGNLVTMDSSLTARAVALAAIQKFGAVTGSFAVLDNTTTADGATDVKHGNGFEATAVYKQDALSVSGGYRSTKDNSAVPADEVTTKDMILAANFDFGVAKLYGQFAQVKADHSASAAFDKKTYETAGVNVPFTSALAGYVELSMGKHDTGTDSPKLTAFAVGAQYNLGKNTAFYGDVGSAKSDQTTLTAGSKVDQVAFGLIHSF